MYYNYEYFKRTSKIDMTENYRFFLQYFDGKTILDLGCGSGRDSNHFRHHGYLVTSIDNSQYAKQFANDKYNIEVKLVDIQTGINGSYDGIWSCASLVHMNKQQLLTTLELLKNNLNVQGIIYISLKYGDGYIESNNQRYYLYTKDLITDLTHIGYKLAAFKITKNENPMDSWIEFILRKK